MKSRRP